ncbi:MAG: hypothetical protein ACKVYV_08215 [Limisphaerales bacterium]
MKSYMIPVRPEAVRRWIGRLKNEVPVLFGVLTVGALAYLYSLG